MQQKLPKFSRNNWISGALLILLVGVFTQYAALERQIDTRNDARNQSLQLADELRQSSDDLTRMVRTYAVTGNPVYKQSYQDILDIRIGKKPRPTKYRGIYWDFVVGQGLPQPTAGERSVALLDLMRELGYTPQELDKLTRAKNQSDGLTRTEFEAMRLTEMKGADATANRARAILMLHDTAYHLAKAQIMQPIDEFHDLVNQRTTKAVQDAKARANLWLVAVIAISLGLIASIARSILVLRNTLGGSIEEVQAHMARIGQGDFSIPISIQQAAPASVLAGLAQTQRNLSRVDQERQAAQTARQEAMREAQTLMDTINMYSIVSISDPSGKIIFANDMFSQISGYSNAELIGNNHRIVKSQIQPDEYWSDMWKTISSGYVWRGTVCNRAKDGTPYWVDTVIAPFFGEHGIEKYVSVRTNITPIKMAEAALKESTDRLRDNAAFLARAGRIAGIGRWQLDLQHGTLDWSDQTCQIHDVASGAQPTLQQSIAFFAPEARDNIQNAIDAAMRTGRPWDLELPLITAMNRRIWVRTAGEAEYQDGKRIRLVGIFQDISQRRKLEDEVRQKNLLMQSILNNLPVGLSVFDSQLNLLVDNQLFRSLLNLPDNLFKGEITRFESIIRFNAERGEYGETDQEASIHNIVERARLARPHHYQRERGDGHTLEIRSAPMPNGGFVTTYADVTDLARATQAAQEASRSKSQFVANMSHEIRTPMNAILGMLRLLHNTELSARQLDYTSKAEGAAQSLLGLLNDVLDFSKMEADKMTLDPQPFQLDRLMRDLAVILSANIGNKRIEVLFDIDPAIPSMLVADELRLQQVLINLGGNAIKFTSAGQVVIQIKVVNHSRRDISLRFAVIDSGIGIAAENQQHIFDGFSQAEASTTRRFGGTGLGLSICKRLIDLMGGSLSLTSVINQGSTFHFTLTLPIAPAAAETPGLAESATARPATSLHILVVDDNTIARELLCDMVRSLDWEASAAASGAAALKILQAGPAAPPFDAVLVDWHMPEMDGWETIAHMRQLPAIRPAPLTIMVTAHGREMLTQHTAQEQSYLSGFLVKPITASMLFETVIDARDGISNMRTKPRSHAGINARLAGLRLLVVEDNRINQQVAQELLSAEGAQVELADNGQLGVDAVARAKPPYDAVLMDIQMPVMDGYAATRTIRLDLGLNQLPIIAMTANALSSDREACLAAGMTDHVGKPFDINHLVAVLCSHLRRSTSIDPAGAAGTTATALVADAIDTAGALARLGGKVALYAQVVQSYLDEIKPLPDQLQAHLQQADHTGAARLLHTLKGLSATVGANPMAATARTLEQAFKVADTTSIPNDALAQFHAAIRATQDAMQQVLAQLSAAASAPAPLAPPSPHTPEQQSALIDELVELQQLLKSSDMRAVDVHAHLLQAYALDVNPSFNALNKAVNRFDFGRGAAECENLLASAI